jgi:hypothetical protein
LNKRPLLLPGGLLILPQILRGTYSPHLIDVFCPVSLRNRRLRAKLRNARRHGQEIQG